MLNQKLLEPGWGGELAPDELALVKAALKADKHLRSRWGMRRVSEHAIRHISEHGAQNASPDESEGDSDDGTFLEGGVYDHRHG